MAIFLTLIFLGTALYFWCQICCCFLLGGGMNRGAGNSEKLVILFENVLLGFWLSLKSRVLILLNVKLDVFSATNLAFRNFRNQSMIKESAQIQCLQEEVDSC